MREVNPNLIRAFADGELTPDRAEQVRAYLEAHPEARAQVEFESRLRDAVRTAMSASPAAPAALAESISRMVEADAAASAATASAQPASHAPQPVAGSSASGGSASPIAALRWAIAGIVHRLTQPRPISAGAVIAVIALVSAAVLIGIFAPQIDTISQPPQVELAADPTEYASQEHDRCASDPEHRDRKLNYCQPHEAVAKLRDHFDVDGVTIFDLSDVGYEFVGESRRCNMPGSKRSAQLWYERHTDGRFPAKVSIFISPVRGDGCPKASCGRELKPGEWAASRRSDRCRKRVLQSTDNQLVYFLVTCDESDAEAISQLVGNTLLAKAR